MGKPATPILRVLVEPGCSGAENMERDAELLRVHGPETPVTLRLYTWNPPAVSLGFMQRPEQVLDLAACGAAGVHVVQRPTGGRAVLHWDEVTYAIVASTADRRFGKSLHESHGVVGEAIAAALRPLGIQASLSRPSQAAERPLSARPCFVSAGRAEVLVEGRKLVGSAQRRTASAFLQHGSLLLGPAHLGLVELLRRTGAAREGDARLRQRLESTTTHLQALLDRIPSFEEMTDALIQGFSRRLRLEAVVERLPRSIGQSS